MNQAARNTKSNAAANTVAPSRGLAGRLGRRRDSGPTGGSPLQEERSHVRELDDRSFTAALDGNVSIVDFWAPWCGPCKVLHPIFDGLAKSSPAGGVQFARVNVDDSPHAASSLAVMSIPTLVMFDADGTEVDRIIGLPDRARLEAFVKSATARTKRGTT